MKSILPGRSSHRHPGCRFAVFLSTAAALLILAAEPSAPMGQKKLRDRIPPAEFSRIISTFSEEGGFFRSDNFISNETSYLHIVDKLLRLEPGGGAYIGVGPEQNFTYIAKLRPRIAFIVDIRRQAVLQHLMYKALFHMAKDRTTFLAILFSRDVRAAGIPSPDADIESILAFLESRPEDEAIFMANLEAIKRAIEDSFRFALSDSDRAGLKYIFSAFKEEGPGIRYRFGGPGWPGSPWSRFPTLRDLILEKDLSGRLGNFLASKRDYDFLRDMQERNCIIPIVGDFAGGKALNSVGEYLRAHNAKVSVFYTSNVEQYLFTSGVFRDYAANVRRLPLSETSLFIRSFPNMREFHPARIGDHRLTTLLQKIQVFLADLDQGLYRDFWTLATTHYIAADAP